MRDRNDALRAALNVAPKNRGFDDFRLSFGNPRTGGRLHGRHEGFGKVLFTAIADYAGMAAVWAWNFDDRRDIDHLRLVIDELEEGVATARRWADELDRDGGDE